MHIDRLDKRMEVINVHCFAVDNLTARCEQTIDEQFDCMIAQIEQTRKQSKDELRASSHLQLRLARDSFIALNNERRLCQELSLQLDKAMTIKNVPEESPLAQRISGLCKEIQKTCLKRKSNDDTKWIGPNPLNINIGQKLVQITTRNLTQMIKGFADAMKKENTRKYTA